MIAFSLLVFLSPACAVCQAEFPRLIVQSDRVEAKVAGLCWKLAVPANASSLREAANKLNIVLEKADTKTLELNSLSRNIAYEKTFCFVCFALFCKPNGGEVQSLRCHPSPRSYYSQVQIGRHAYVHVLHFHCCFL